MPLLFLRPCRLITFQSKGTTDPRVRARTTMTGNINIPGRHLNRPRQIVLSNAIPSAHDTNYEGQSYYGRHLVEFCFHGPMAVRVTDLPVEVVAAETSGPVTVPPIHNTRFCREFWSPPEVGQTECRDALSYHVTEV